MQKPNKTLRTVLICVVALVAVVAIGRIVVGQVAQKKVREALTQIPGVRLDVKSMSFSLIAGSLDLRDVEFEVSDSTNAEQQLKGRIDAIMLKGISWRKLMKGEAHADRLTIRKPVAQVVLSENAPEKKAEAEKAPADTSFLKRVSLSELRIEKASVDMSQGDALKASVKEFSASLQDIGLNLPDGSLEFNDSTYTVSLDSLDFSENTSFTRVQVGHLATANAGPVEGLGVRAYTTVTPDQMAVKMGKVSVMWMDVKLDSLSTSAINIPRIIKDKNIAIESMRLAAPDIVLVQNDRYPPKVPYPTLQEGLNTLDMPLNINKIDASIKNFVFKWETKPENIGSLPMKNVRLALESVSNAPGNTLKLGMRLSEKGLGQWNYTLYVKNDKKESTSGKMLIKNLDPATMDSFLRPLFGATAKADIHQIDLSFKGDKNKMTADFCMTYDNMSIKAWDDASAPFSFVAKNSGAVTFLANAVLPKSNPTRAGKDPKKVEYGFERDPMLPYPSYLISALTNGMLHTVLPGKSVKKNKTNKTKKN